MTTYTAITNDQVDQDSPVTQPLIEALNSNPLAIAEGDPSAPKVQAGALNIPFGVDSRTTAGVIFTITDLDRVARGFLVTSARATAGTASKTVTTRFRLSSDNGATWGSYVTASSATSTENGIAVERQDFNLPNLSSANAIEVSTTTAGTTGSMLGAAIFFAVTGVSP
jgi:hypothetical protein